MEIQHLKHNEINTLKWDKRVRDSFNGVVFAFSWYLDIVSEDWEALVSDDYDYIMPLPTRHIMGVTYIVMPRFVSQLGVFTRQTLYPENIEQFVDKIPYPFMNLAFNVHNIIDESPQYKLRKTPCYKLDLISSYQRAKQRYNTHFKSKLVKAISANIAVQNGISPNDFVTFMQTEAILKDKLHQDSTEMLRRIAVNAVRYRVGTIYGAYSRTNTLCAAALIAGSHNKTYVIAAAASKEGIKENAVALMLDVFMEKQSEYNLTAQFDGLDLPDGEMFINGIGAERYSLVSLTQNNLPWYFGLIR